jgi:hypothetical protein
LDDVNHYGSHAVLMLHLILCQQGSVNWLEGTFNKLQAVITLCIFKQKIGNARNVDSLSCFTAMSNVCLELVYTNLSHSPVSSFTTFGMVQSNFLVVLSVQKMADWQLDSYTPFGFPVQSKQLIKPGQKYINHLCCSKTQFVLIKWWPGLQIW